MTASTRRERLRTATVSEIKDGARRLLVTGGPQAISLRAIARDMGMTAPAIYRYFPSLDALVLDLAGDLFDELLDTIEQARDSVDADRRTPVDQSTRTDQSTLTDQILAMAHAFRRWSVGHPVEFAMMFGSPVPGTTALVGDCDDDHPAAQLCEIFMRPFVALWHGRPFTIPVPHLVEDRLGPALEPLRCRCPELPVEVAYLFLAGWIRLYGLVAMEVFGHLQWAVTDPEALFETDLAHFIEQLSGNGAG